VLAFVPTALAELEVHGKRVLEVGSFNVNGSVRAGVEALGPEWYVGMDQCDGPGVDMVVDASVLTDTFGRDSVDVVITTECLEHVADWRAVIWQLVSVLCPGGLLVVTTRSPGYHYHPSPEDHWRYSLDHMRLIFGSVGMDVLRLESDPEAPGVFVKARKPLDWQRDAAVAERNVAWPTIQLGPPR
jgi:predicted SAM-dependent methyltransferase